MKLRRDILLPTGLLMTLGCSAMAAEPVSLQIVIHEHRFEPAELHAPAGVALVIMVHNADATAEEFESTDLNLEKVIPGGRTLPVRLRPLKPGRYSFTGEYHSDTAKGVLIVEE